MLTPDDIHEIQKIVNPLAEDIKDIKKDIVVVQTDLKVVQTDIKVLKTDLKDVKKRVKKVEKTTDIMIRIFDHADVKLHKRVTKIEEHLNILN